MSLYCHFEHKKGCKTQNGHMPSTVHSQYLDKKHYQFHFSIQPQLSS